MHCHTFVHERRSERSRFACRGWSLVGALLTTRPANYRGIGDISGSILVELSGSLAQRFSKFLFGAIGGGKPLQALKLRQIHPPAESMREVISIHLGQCGVQIGNACWELYCLVRPRALEHTARDPRTHPRWRSPSARAIRFPSGARCARHPNATRTRIGAASSSCLAHHPIPTAPIHPLTSRRPSLPIPTGARHPARWPDALGQDDRRR